MPTRSLPKWESNRLQLRNVNLSPPTRLQCRHLDWFTFRARASGRASQPFPGSPYRSRSSPLFLRHRDAKNFGCSAQFDACIPLEIERATAALSFHVHPHQRAYAKNERTTTPGAERQREDKKLPMIVRLGRSVVTQVGFLVSTIFSTSCFRSVIRSVAWVIFSNFLGERASCGGSDW